MSNQKLNLYIIVGIVFVLTFGVTYAYFNITLRNAVEPTQMVTETGTLELNYIDGDYINGERVFPGWSANKTIVVTNIGSLDAYYKIFWKELTNNFEQDELILKAVCTSYEHYGEANQVISGSCNDIEETPVANVAGSIKENIGVEVGFTHVYSFTFTFKEMSSLQNYNQGKTFGGVLNIDDSYGLYTMNGTLLDSEGEPLANTQVLLSNGKSATTNAQGRFIIEEVDEGNYQLTIGEVTDSLIIETGRELASSENTITSNIENKEINVTIQLGTRSLSYDVTEPSSYDMDILAMYVDGIKTASLDDDKRYTLISSSCANGEQVFWNVSNNTLSITPLYNTTRCTINFTEALLEITLNANGGETVQNISYGSYNSRYSISAVPTRDNYIFAGWFLSPNILESERITNNTIIQNDSNHTVYAGWQLEETVFPLLQEYTYAIHKSGVYKLEVWGAQGGSNNTTYVGGYGGYSAGNVELNSGDILYVNIGGMGSNNAGGRNGGGAGGNSSYKGGGGGGATHIAQRSGLLSTLSSHLDDLLIVAGGGGGGVVGYDNSSYGAAGGGYLGNSSVNTARVYSVGIGGGQTPLSHAYGGSFGVGGSTGDLNTWGGGGGGGFYGGTGSSGAGGGGGSGYIANTKLYNKYMYCNNCDTSSEVDTLTSSTPLSNSTATPNQSKKGNGYARITYISE